MFQIYEIPFYVAIDRETNAVIVAIRGTLSLQVNMPHCLGLIFDYI